MSNKNLDAGCANHLKLDLVMKESYCSSHNKIYVNYSLLCCNFFLQDHGLNESWFFIRNFRSKTTIAATNELKNKEYLNALLFSTGMYITVFYILTWLFSCLRTLGKFFISLEFWFKFFCLPCASSSFIILWSILENV